ncbi:hypothetical protein SS37A_06830 [Methylocystis iwaonis]|uniref:Tetratricopeptide repeat protein n=2 Tax=Methylocystis iwaonis TaxID=2885079 RepID=A0ABN6VD67_9HYPH|nr:hypothetical protein SS37A_06830 [Methylocystis iwaonis]
MAADMDIFREVEGVDFGTLPGPVDTLLQQGVVAYRSDKARADRLFRQALDLAPEALAAYFCLYKIHTYMGNLETAKAAALDGMREAARQAGWPDDPRFWPAGQSHTDGPARFALFTLKALTFIELKRGDRSTADAQLKILSIVDPAGSVGWPVIAALAEGAAGASGMHSPRLS